MKLKLLIVAAFLLIGANTAHAQLFGWHGSVTFTTGINTFSVNFSGPTYWDCEAQRGIAKNLYSPPTYSVVDETPCISLFIDPTIFIIPEYKLPFPFPDPVCLSCPYLREDLIDVIYPRHVDHVRQLMDKYQVNEYNKALDDLKTQFDLQGFEAEMYMLEQEINHGMQR